MQKLTVGRSSKAVGSPPSPRGGSSTLQSFAVDGGGDGRDWNWSCTGSEPSLASGPLSAASAQVSMSSSASRPSTVRVKASVVFSHSSRENCSSLAYDQVEAMVKEFENFGIHRNRIVYQYEAGAYWSELWAEAVREASVVVVMLDESYMRKDVCIAEFSFIFDLMGQIAVIPCEPSQLAKLKGFRPESGGEGCGRVVRELWDMPSQQLYLSGPRPAAAELFKKYLQNRVWGSTARASRASRAQVNRDTKTSSAGTGSGSGSDASHNAKPFTSPGIHQTKGSSDQHAIVDVSNALQCRPKTKKIVWL